MTRAAPTGELSTIHVLVVDDEEDIRTGLRLLLTARGFRVSTAASGAEALRLVDREGADIVVTDLQMPGMSGAELLAEVKKRSAETAVIVLTGFGTIQTAVWCMAEGASHFLTKPSDNDEIVTILTRVGRQILAARHPGERVVVAVDPRMQRALELVRRVAPTPVPVLVEGETGVGKEVIARAIHERSTVCARPFLAVNAAALPDTLLEAELFGYVRGAFTGADADRKGLFEEARGGTVFLDEVGSMSLAFQGKLLRVLQEKVVRPLGASRDVSVDFRLVAATNRDLAELSRSGAFREDLYYRLRVVSIHVPPLRERPLDILPLAEHFLARAAGACLGLAAPVPLLTDDSVAALLAYRWPGNVRELQNTMQRAVVVCGGDRIRPHHLGLGTSGWGASASESADDYEEGKRRAVERFQREFVQRALENARGNVTQAASACGLTRAAFQRILRQLGIDRAEFEGD